MVRLKQEKKSNCGMYQLVDGHHFDLVFLCLSALFLFFQTKKHKSQLEQCFQVRKGKVLKEKNDNTGKNKLEKTFANNFKVFLGTNSKKYILSDFEEKKT